MLARLLATTLALAALAATAPAQECPDEKATDVEGHVKESKKYQRCGFGFQLFGHDLDLFGEKCPRWKKIYPEHQKCQGETLVGHECVYDELLEVSRLDCDCAQATIIFDTGLAFPECDCDYGGVAGYIEDFTTRECEDD